MPQPPAQPKIYHILHIDRLASVVAAGGLRCDAEMQRRGGGGTTIGMGRIKARRLSLPVACHPGDHVGDHVPFYFCPRSLMLYLIYRANHQDLAYRGGQGPIIHLEADVHTTVAWAEAHANRWAFTRANASASYAALDSSRFSAIPHTSEMTLRDSPTFVNNVNYLIACNIKGDTRNI